MNKEDIVRLIRKSGKPSAGLDEALTKKVPDFSRTFNVGGRNRTRTCDPIDVNDVLYRLSHATIYVNRLQSFMSVSHSRTLNAPDQRFLASLGGIIPAGPTD